MVVIREGETEFTGLIERDGYLVCEKCHSQSANFVTHLDAKDYFKNIYKCDCGNQISTKTARTGLNKEFWA